MVFPSESETNPHMTIAVVMLLVSVESVFCCVKNGVPRSCAILNKIFPSSSSQADLCACCVHRYPIHLMQQC